MPIVSCEEASADDWIYSAPYGLKQKHSYGLLLLIDCLIINIIHRCSICNPLLVGGVYTGLERCV